MSPIVHVVLSADVEVGKVAIQGFSRKKVFCVSGEIR